MTVVMYRSQQHGRRGQRIDTSSAPGKAKLESDIVIAAYWGKLSS